MTAAILGAGKIGSALLGGILKAGIISQSDIYVTARSLERASFLASEYGVRTSSCNPNAVIGADVIILAVKPMTARNVLTEIRPVIKPSQVIVSVSAAVSIASIERWMGHSQPVFRAMPNIPVLVQEGAIALCSNLHASAAHWETVQKIFGAVGLVCRVEESMIDAVTALSGSGPAYVYMIMEALIAGGVKMGLPREVATLLTEQTVLGAGKHALQAGVHPAILRDEVTTPAGTTIAAIHELERHGLRSTLISAVEAATCRARELSRTITEEVDRSSQP